MYQGHTIEERWTSIMVTVILLSSSRAGPLLIHVNAFVDRCPWYMRQKYFSIRCRVENSVSICYAGKPQPMPDSVLALVELILASCRGLSKNCAYRRCFYMRLGAKLAQGSMRKRKAHHLLCLTLRGWAATSLRCVADAFGVL